MQNNAGHGPRPSRDLAENNEAIPGVGTYHKAHDFAAPQGAWPAPAMTPEEADGHGADESSNDGRSPRPHVPYPYDSSLGTTPALMDTRSTTSDVDLSTVRRRSTVRSGIFKTVDDFQDFDVGGPGWHRTQTFYNQALGCYANNDSL